MDALITYDLVENATHESKHLQVKKTMKENGYNDRFVVTKTDQTKVTYYLPNTSLWKKNTEPAQAKADLEAAVKKHSATLERCLAVEFTNSFEAIPGKAYAS